MKALGTFTVSVPAGDPQKGCCAHSSLRTSAKASEKVGCPLPYHAARLVALENRASGRCANKVTSENNPNSAGVVLRIAKSDHCIWVSNPRCRRTSWKVASICQRITNQTWVTSIIQYGEFEGLKLPVRGKALWKLPAGDYEYVEVTITELEYDVGKQ